MSFTLLILIFTYLLVLVINYCLKKTIFDALFFIISPYVFIIAINNLLMVKLGFYKISDHTIIVHIFALVLFFFGGMLGEYLDERVNVTLKLDKFYLSDINPNMVNLVSLISIIIVLADLFLLSRSYGFMGLIAGGDTIERGFLASHITILFSPLILLNVDLFLQNKKLISVLFVLIMMALVFLTFIKYHIISMIISVVIFIALRYPQYIKRIGLASLIVIVGAFILNYIVNFSSNDMDVSNSFYLNHLWKYIGGSSINVDNLYEKFVPNYEYSFVNWIISMILGLPIMLINRLTGLEINLYHFSTDLPLYFVANPKLQEESNVISLLGAAYIQSNLLVVSVFAFAWGCIAQWIFARAKRNSSIGLNLVASIFLGYSMLSFFSSFFELTMPWEAMLLSFMLVLFLRLKRYKNSLVLS